MCLHTLRRCRRTEVVRAKDPSDRPAVASPLEQVHLRCTQARDHAMFFIAVLETQIVAAFLDNVAAAIRQVGTNHPDVPVLVAVPA